MRRGSFGKAPEELTPYGALAGETENDWLNRKHREFAEMGRAWRKRRDGGESSGLWTDEALEKRTLLVAALDYLGRAATSLRVAACCSDVYVFRDRRTGRFAYTSNTCNHRFCPRCGIRRCRTAAELFIKTLPEAKHAWVMGTLTIAHTEGESLWTSMRKLRKAWAKFKRSCPEWVENCRGGVSVIEVKPSASFANAWHVHMHFVADMKYCSWMKLAAGWVEAGGGFSKFDRVGRDGQAVCMAAKYIAKYLSKGLDPGCWTSVEKLAEVCQVLRNVKMINRFGAVVVTECEGVEKTKKACADGRADKDRWEYCGSLGALLRGAEAGDGAAAAVLVECGFGDWRRSDTLFVGRHVAARATGPPTLFEAA